jgi:hypothetical protein
MFDPGHPTLTLLTCLVPADVTSDPLRERVIVLVKDRTYGFQANPHAKICVES